MAYYFIFPEKDTTIYSQPDRINLNAGQDEILEIVKERGTLNQQYYPSRTLIQFDSNDITDVFQNKIPTSAINTNTWKANLELFATRHRNLSSTTNLKVFAVSQSWDEGTGRFNNNPTGSNGATWKYTDNDTTQTHWTTGSIVTGATYATASFMLGYHPTGSLTELTVNGVDFVPVTSASLFDSNNSEVFVQLSASVDLFGENLSIALNASSSLTMMSASYNPSNNRMTLSGSVAGTSANITIFTSSVNPNPLIEFVGLEQDGTLTAGFPISSGSDSIQGGFGPNSTGSINAVGIDEGGGSWWTTWNATQQITANTAQDINMDVTDMVNAHQNYLINSSTYPTGIPNRGFIIKHLDSVETDTSSSEGELMFFSHNTHTIYPPKLTFRWDDSSYSHSGTTLTSGDIFLSLYNNKATYQRKSKQRFRLTTRKRYPDRTFTTSSNYLNLNYLPETSYYSLRDGETDEVIIPFDTSYTKLSADSEGMYFDLFMEGLQPERYYKLMFRADTNDGIKIFDEDYIFKVIR